MKIKLLLGLMLLTGFMNASYASHKARHSETLSNPASASVKAVPTLFSRVTSLEALQSQLEQAKNARQPVMIEFYASWCPSCRSLDTYVFSLPQVQKRMQPFKNIRVDLTKKDDELMQIVMYYQVSGTPTFIFYDKNGNEFNTDRFKNLDELIQVLEKLGR